MFNNFNSNKDVLCSHYAGYPLIYYFKKKYRVVDRNRQIYPQCICFGTLFEALIIMQVAGIGNEVGEGAIIFFESNSFILVFPLLPDVISLRCCIILFLIPLEVIQCIAWFININQHLYDTQV